MASTRSRRVDLSWTRLWVTLSAVVWLTAAAAAQKVTVEIDPAADFHKYKTFAIREGQLRSPSPVLNSELTKKRLESELERALERRGLARTAGPADLNVSYIFGSMHHTETEYSPGVRRNRTRSTRVSRIEGNLVIDIRDASTKGLLWHAVATEDQSEPAKLSDRIDDMVKKAVAKFPAKK